MSQACRLGGSVAFLAHLALLSRHLGVAGKTRAWLISKERMQAERDQLDAELQSFAADDEQANRVGGLMI